MSRHITSAKNFNQAIYKIIKTFKWLDKDGLIKDNVKIPKSKHTILFESNKGTIINMVLININGRVKDLSIEEAKNYLDEEYLNIVKYIKPSIFGNAYFEPINKNIFKNYKQ